MFFLNKLIYVYKCVFYLQEYRPDSTIPSLGYGPLSRMLLHCFFFNILMYVQYMYKCLLVFWVFFFLQEYIPDSLIPSLCYGLV